MTFKRVNSFTTASPAKLDRELAQFEENAAAEFNSLRRELAPVLRVANFAATPTRGIVAILPEQQLSIDTSLANASVIFPALQPGNFGRPFVLIKRTNGPFTLKTSCQDPAVTFNSGAFPVFTLAGIVIFYCDSSGYWGK